MSVKITLLVLLLVALSTCQYYGGYPTAGGYYGGNVYGGAYGGAYGGYSNLGYPNYYGDYGYGSAAGYGYLGKK